jgi:hypothetical protein
MGLVIALGTYFAVIYMQDEHPVVQEFEVTQIKNDWKSGTDYKSGDYVHINDEYFVANIDHTSDKNWTKESWDMISGIPHTISWSISTADLIEINSKNPGNPFYYQYSPADEDNVEGSRIAILEQVGTTEDFRIKVRSEAFWVENN